MKIVIDVPEELYEAYKGRPPMLGDEGMDMIARAIANGIPYDERPTGKWIPCGERLPDLYEVVLVTDECGKVFEYERRPLDDDGNVSREWSFLGRNIIAWMPLPKPYKEANNDRPNL